MRRINTKKGGVAKTITFPTKNGYKAVCLDFDIIEEAKSREEVDRQIKEAIVGYIMNVCKNNLSDKLLNRHADKKYWEMYYQYQKLISAKNESRVRVSNNIKKSSLFTIPIGELVKNSVCCAA